MAIDCWLKFIYKSTEVNLLGKTGFHMLENLFESQFTIRAIDLFNDDLPMGQTLE